MNDIPYLLQYGEFTSLSRAEAYAFASKNALDIRWEDSSYLVLSASKPIDPYFGSIIRVAEFYSKLDDFLNRFDTDLQYDDKTIRWSLYFLSGKEIERQRLKSAVESQIKARGKKSIYVNPSPTFSEAGGISLTKAVRAKLSSEGYEFVLAKYDGGLAVWRTVKHLDLKGFRERDLNRPYKNPLISMPPWLARSMVNLAALQKGGKLLDPFCGTGTILIEALDADLTAYGVDIDPNNVFGARANVTWLKTKKAIPSCTIINGDARNLTNYFPTNYFDAVVTEPPFGPPINKPVSLKEIYHVVDRLVELYVAVFSSISTTLRRGGVVVFTLPAWRMKSGGLYELRAEKVLAETDLALEKSIGSVSLPIKWSKPDNLIHRLIYLAYKSNR